MLLKYLLNILLLTSTTFGYAITVNNDLPMKGSIVGNNTLTYRSTADVLTTNGVKDAAAVECAANEDSAVKFKYSVEAVIEAVSTGGYLVGKKHGSKSNFGCHSVQTKIWHSIP
jgi:hypothetical protein